MVAKRGRPADGPRSAPPSGYMGVPSRDVGPSDASLIVAAGTRKERLRERAAKLDSRHRSPRPYAELRVSSAFSFLDGASLPEDLIEQAARLGLPAMALVDRNGVYGAPRFYKAARAAGIRALVGAEVTLGEKTTGGLGDWGTGGKAAHSPRPQVPQSLSQHPRLTLLVENRAGYKSLCRLITAGAAGKPKGETSVTLENVASHAEGVHCLTGGEEGLVARAFARGGLAAGRATPRRPPALFPRGPHARGGKHPRPEGGLTHP